MKGGGGIFSHFMAHFQIPSCHEYWLIFLRALRVFDKAVGQFSTKRNFPRGMESSFV